MNTTLIGRETVFAGSGKGLMARLVMTTDAYAYRTNMTSIAYEVFVSGASQSPAVTGTLVVNTVMLTALTAWAKDPIGKTFHWDAPGTLWPAAGTTYVLVVTFTPNTGEVFKAKWIVDAVDSRDE